MSKKLSHFNLHNKKAVGEKGLDGWYATAISTGDVF